MKIEHVENHDRGDFLIKTPDGSGLLGELSYTWQGGDMVINHTGVRPAGRGQGIAKQLVYAAVEAAREGGFKIRPHCSYAEKVFRENSDTLHDVMQKQDERPLP